MYRKEARRRKREDKTHKENEERAGEGGGGGGEVREGEGEGEGEGMISISLALSLGFSPQDFPSLCCSLIVFEISSSVRFLPLVLLAFLPSIIQLSLIAFDCL